MALFLQPNCCSTSSTFTHKELYLGQITNQLAVTCPQITWKAVWPGNSLRKEKRYVGKNNNIRTYKLSLFRLTKWVYNIKVWLFRSCSWYAVAWWRPGSCPGPPTSWYFNEGSQMLQGGQNGGDNSCKWLEMKWKSCFNKFSINWLRLRNHREKSLRKILKVVIFMQILAHLQRGIFNFKIFLSFISQLECWFFFHFWWITEKLWPFEQKN